MDGAMSQAVISSVVSEVVKFLFEPIARKLSYVFKYKSYVEELSTKVGEIKMKKEMMDQHVKLGRRQGDEIYKSVDQLLIKVNEFIERVDKFFDGYEEKDKPNCVSPKTCYNISKEAVKAKKEAADLLTIIGNLKLDTVSFQPSPDRADLMNDVEGYHKFDSRMKIFQDVMEALKDSKVNIIGVYGMGGVGKTTLVKEVARKVMEENVFDEVVMAEVTLNPDLKTIQDKIAYDLGFTFGQNESGFQRAGRLRRRLKKEKRVLVILDNIWSKLDFEAVGIPLSGVEKERQDDQRQCTILLTCRNEYVLRNDMNSQKTFLISILSDEEAMSLFRKIVGDGAENSDGFYSTVVQIVRKCAGLPIAIKTIANALKNKDLPSWLDALDQLNNSNPIQIHGMEADVYSTIKLSFNFLDKEAKSLLLLCGLHKDGSAIMFDNFIRYGMGLGLFKQVRSLEAARNRVHKLIDDLKAACLLLDADIKDYFKMHDIIHAVAVSIAADDELMFNIQNIDDLKEELENAIQKDPIAISLPYGDIQELPERFECPKLQLFLLLAKYGSSLHIQDLFFEGMRQLRVLHFTEIRFASLPSSLGCLFNLQTLSLDSCKLPHVAIVGELKKLEILSFRDSDIEQLPVEIGQLKRLRLLDLSMCPNLKVIAPNVISKLSRLEELYMGNSFTRWEKVGGSNASLVELKALSKLTTLDIQIPDAKIMPQDLVFVNLERYRIFIGNLWYSFHWYTIFECSRTLKLNGLDKNIYLGHWMKRLLKRTEDLNLGDLKGFQNIIHDLDEEGFPRLKHLRLQNAPEILYIVNSEGQISSNVFPLLESLFFRNLTKLEKICHGQLPEDQSFSKLRIIRVSNCDRLKHLFSFSMAKNLLRLQETKVTDCKNLKVFVAEESEIICGIVNFSKLHSLALRGLPQLTSSGFKEVTADDDSDKTLFNNTVIFPSLEKLELSQIDVEKLWPDQFPPLSTSLTTLTVEKFSRLKFLSSYSTVSSLVRLQKLEIRKCESMECVIDTTGLGKDEERNNISVEFRSLHRLYIVDCFNLRRFISMSSSQDNILHNDMEPLFDEKVRLPSLEVLTIQSVDNLEKIWHDKFASDSFSKLKNLKVAKCGKLVNMFPYDVIMERRLKRLENLEVDGCDSIEEIIEETSPDSTMVEEVPNRFDVFSRLNFLKLWYLPKLKSLYRGIHILEWPALKRIWLYKCEKLEIVFASSESLEKESQKPLFLVDHHKVAFPSMEMLQLSSLPELLHLCKGNSQPSKVFQNLATLEISECGKLQNLVSSSVSFQNLTTLEVSKCDGLRYLITLSTAESLVNLSSIMLTDCKMIETIIQRGGEEVEDNYIIFSQLKYLELDCLPSLASFCLGNHSLEFPSLEKVVVSNCPKMKIFSEGVLHTPKLQRLQLKKRGEDEGCWEGNLNTTIQQLFKTRNVQNSKEEH